MNSQTFRFQLGQFSCLSILDCTSSYPAELFFSNVPRERLEILLRGYNQDSQQIEIPYICLFIQADHKRVLIDTGIGVQGFGSARGNLLQHLRAESIEPDDIDAVILSHGHGDHIGGIVDPEGRVVFRNARYVMHKAEWAYWDGQPTLEELPISRDFKEGILDFARRNLSPIRDQVDLVDDNTKILPGITAVPSYGHSPGHMTLHISSAGEHLLFVGDAFIHPLHIEYPETIALVDHQPEKMISTRLRLRERAANERCLVLGSHFPFPGLGHIQKRTDQWKWEPFPASTSTTSEE
jgi:glyoxylase-like metal-dependent hydrolase (beta-lactamase superfamily II)